MKISSISCEEVFRALVTSKDGLTEEEAKKRLAEFGPNEIAGVKKKPLYIKFVGQFTHFLALLLWIAAAMAFLSEYLHPKEGMLTLGVAILGVIFINAVFTFIQEYRAERSIEKMRRLLPYNVTVLRAGIGKVISAREVVPGDVIQLVEGLKVPADSRVIESAYLTVNNAPLTGESEPRSLDERPSVSETIEVGNIAFAGATVVSGRGKAVVFASGMRTEFGRIAHLTSAVEAGLSPLQKEIVKVTRFIAVMATATGVVFFLIGHLIGRSFWENFIFTIGLIIANVPEGLLPTVTLALVMGSRRMLRKKALIKTLTSVETLGSVSVICTDKTGTLTQNRMAAKKIFFDGRIVLSEDLKTAHAEKLLSTAYFCNNAVFSEGEYRGDPMEVALLKTASEAIVDIEIQRIAEIPFDTERKRMTTVNRTGHEVIAFTKGATEGLLPLCSRICLGDSVISLDEGHRMRILEACHELMGEGLRVLSFSYREIQDTESADLKASEIERDMVFAGLIGLEDPPRPEVPDAIARCKEAGIRVVMITGDAGRTAVAIAKEIGLVKGEPLVIEGREFVSMDDETLRRGLSAEEVIFARMMPKHKMRVVSLLQEEGATVAVTGDGVNDAPALKKADIGIAMGLSGTDVAKEAADMVLLDDNFATIVNAVEEGRGVFENIRKFITYIFAHGTPEAVPYILYALFKVPLPLTVMQILAIDLGTETLPALALGVEPPESDVMKRPPRGKGKGLIDRKILFRGYLFLGLLSAIGVLFGYFYVLKGGGWHWGVNLPADAPLTREASTATFLGIVIMQIGVAFACRTQTESAFRAGVFGNRLLLWGVLFELCLSGLIIYSPWGQKIFNTAAVSPALWLMLAPFALLVFLSDEIRKLFVRMSAKEAVRP